MGKSNKKSIKPFRRLNNQPNESKKIAVAKKVNIVSGRVSKKTKRQQKKSEFLSKLTISDKEKAKLKKAKMKAQTAIVGNMDPLLDALADITATTSIEKKNKELSNSSKPFQLRKKKIASEKKRQQSDINDISLFQKVISHGKFQNNPLFAISDHVKYLVQKEEMEQS